MRLLVLGGTMMVGRKVAELAISSGHEVLCAARGLSGQVPEGARLIPIDRDHPESMEALRGERFDAVVDVAQFSVNWVRQALGVLAPTTDHWTFVSSVSVYADTRTRGQTTDSPVHEPGEDGVEFTPEQYGRVKVASELAVREAMDDRAFVVRPGLITGEGDHHDRYGYWPNRLCNGGQVVIPDTGMPVQSVDNEDLGRFIVHAARHRLAGTFDAVSEPRPMREEFDEIAELVAPADTEFVPMSSDALVAAGVNPWTGDRSLPLWVPAEYDGLMAHDAASAYEAGLVTRPFAEKIDAVLAQERLLGVDRARKAGLSADQEAELLRTV
ncbi:NAD-dependent epimerase/dehydratase family protein [Pseudonocardiaceae bacterium YIM PH 21723]|nr:NAD-dependent epimerase/dehydratase family protein [Pseudonocardiaceae bacterium YIM PH 21723]